VFAGPDLRIGSRYTRDGTKAGSAAEGVPMSGIDKVKNAVEDVTGKVKEKVGETTDDKSLENEGRADQSKADLKNAGEKVKDAFKK
jgi:uncharacterized protein YjbJ (UPF0337 family)